MSMLSCSRRRQSILDEVHPESPRRLDERCPAVGLTLAMSSELRRDLRLSEASNRKLRSPHTAEPDFLLYRQKKRPSVRPGIVPTQENMSEHGLYPTGRHSP